MLGAMEEHTDVNNWVRWLIAGASVLTSCVATITVLEIL
jgi:hypothetical protein